MKVLWLCPIMLPDFAEHFGEKRNPKGGWLTGLFIGLKNNVQIDLCCPGKNCDTWGVEVVNGTTNYIFKRTEDLTNVFKEIILSDNPDIINIWGIDKKSSYDMVNAAEALGLINRVVIVIQGFASLSSKYHFFCFLPPDIISRESPVEYKYRISLQNQRDDKTLIGSYEIEVYKKVKHVIGRTTYAYTCSSQINPSLNYYQCYESLRPAFYDNKWEYDKCEKYSIFVSQSHYSVKGFHIMLDAMTLILKRYPSARLYTTGQKPKVPETFKERCEELAYPSYIAKLIRDNNLEEKVEFVGTLSETRMCERYLRSNVSVSCSSIEAESNSVAEAMLLGMPIVSSYVGGVIEFIEHKKNGYLYQADAPYMLAYYVCKVFDDVENAVLMGQEARQNAKQYFDRETNIRRMTDIYNTILDDC